MILIIAYGNSLRQDDGAGFELADHLAQLLHQRDIAVQQLNVQQLVPELAAIISGDDISLVVFADTRVTTQTLPTPQVEITPLVTPEISSHLGHQLEAAMLLLYASQLYGQAPPAWLFTAPGSSFGYGETLSPLTHQALKNAREVLEPWIEEQLGHGIKVF